MRRSITKLKFITLSVLMIFSATMFATKTGKIAGVVSDKESGETLMGANVSIVSKAVGSATDIDGRYTIVNIVPGTYKVRASYLGYKSQVIDVNVIEGKTLELNFELSLEAIEGEVVTVTAQREGQLAAINQQIQSDEIKSVVSADKIEELPEANAAEAVGRLPGISLMREGGEGSKVVIRGLEPKYNKVQVDGVDLSSTESWDRSTDLSMISPFMLDGIEVTKSAMADQEANQLGGTVNFKLKSAPFSGPSYQVILEGGYNGLRSKYNDYKVVAQHTRRLFDNTLGVSFTVDIEDRNRSSNTVSAGYEFEEADQIPVISTLNILDITRDIERLGGTIILDYKKDGTDIQFSNILTRINRNTVSRSENTSGLAGTSTSQRTQNLSYSESTTNVVMSRFNIEQYIGQVKIDAGVSFSYSDNDVPEQLSYGGLENTPLKSIPPKNARPEDIAQYMKNDLSLIYLNQLNDANSFTKGTELSSHLDFSWELDLAKDVYLKVKTGGKYEHKTKSYDYNTLFFPIQYTKNKANNALLEKYPWMEQYMVNQKFPYLPFIDVDYDAGDFMAGEFDIERIPQLELGREMIHYLQEYLGINWKGSTEPTEFVPNFHSSNINDYNGTEDYLGLYVMPSIAFGKSLKITPGFRYEKNNTEYKAVRANGNLISRVGAGLAYHDTTATRDNEFFLPMIHVRYKPNDWFDVRASYTHTLSRPSYMEFLPRWYLNQRYIDYANPNLKPSKSENIDLYFSFYGNKIGLLTIGGFVKRIDDLIFYYEKTIIDQEMATDEYGFTEENVGANLSTFKGMKIGNFINNPSKAEVYGLEVEWQTNTWFLPGLLQNIVFSINYTYTHSEVDYPRSVPIIEMQNSPFGKRPVIVGNEDQPFSAPLLFQPDHILNVTLGYDYKDFSIRSSVQYKSNIFSSNSWIEDMRGNTEPFTIFDMSISQKLPIEGLVLFGNIKNISKAIEEDTNQGNGYFTQKQYYGLSAGFGIKYKF